MCDMVSPNEPDRPDRDLAACAAETASLIRAWTVYDFDTASEVLGSATRRELMRIAGNLTKIVAAVARAHPDLDIPGQIDSSVDNFLREDVERGLRDLFGDDPSSS